MDTPQASEKRQMTTEEIIAELVVYHKPDEAALAKIDEIRAATKNLLLVIARNCPWGPDRTAAVLHARETMMHANASLVVPQHVI